MLHVSFKRNNFTCSVGGYPTKSVVALNSLCIDILHLIYYLIIILKKLL